jgi:tetratricopeptide (TPR) repeat protein
LPGLADPKRALEAYEKAVELDPDDLDSLYWTGAIRIGYGDLNKAEARLQRVLTLAKTEDQAPYQYWALLGLGDTKKLRGDLAGALKSYNDGLAIGEPLAKSDPGNAKWQYALGISNERIGTVQHLASALKSYEAKRDIIAQLAKLEPGVLRQDWQRANGAGRSCRRAEILFGQPRHQSSPREIRSRQCGMAARSRGEL